MARLLLILAFVAVIFWVFTVVDCAVQPVVRHRGVSKPVWMLIVIILPVIGGVLWFTLGRIPAGSPAVRAPDDDPEFLRGLSTTGGAGTADTRARAEQEKRIRQLEQELSKLDDDDDKKHGDKHGSGPRGR